MNATHDRDADRTFPLAYLISFTTYGTRLHGCEQGSVDRRHRAYGSDYLRPDPVKVAGDAKLMRQGAYCLDAPRRRLVLTAITEVCQYKGWPPQAAHVRTRHVHVVVQAATTPERVMNAFKAYASRALNVSFPAEAHRDRWTRHGSTEYLWEPDDVERAIMYVVDEQGEKLDVFDSREADRAEAAERKPR